MPADRRLRPVPPASSGSLTETDRIRSVFTQRDRSTAHQSHWQLSNPACLQFVQERERRLLALLLRNGFDTSRLETAGALSLGCGTGAELLDLVRYGAMPSNLAGVDLSRERLRRAGARNPALKLTEANATAVPFREASFDLVLQFTLLTSVLEPESRGRIAAEMLRLLRPGGMIIWYDFWPDNPRNPDVRGIRPAEIRSLFPGCTFDFQALTLPPPLARWLVPRSWLLADLLSRFPPLRSFYLVGIRRAHA